MNESGVFIRRFSEDTPSFFSMSSLDLLEFKIQLEEAMSEGRSFISIDNRYISIADIKEIAIKDC